MVVASAQHQTGHTTATPSRGSMHMDVQVPRAHGRAGAAGPFGLQRLGLHAYVARVERAARNPGPRAP